MNKKGNNIKSYIALVVILLAALVFIFYLLDSEKNNRKAKPISDNNTTVSTTTNKESDETTTTTIAVDNNTEVSTPAGPLSDVIENLSFIGNYSITTYYHGVEFDFNCTNYDINSDSCLEGSALMKVNDLLYPLYTYDNESDNYLLRGDDYYISLDDNIVLLYTSNSGVSVGSARVFDRSGMSLGTLTNTLTSYVYNNNLHTKMYPNFEDNRIYYYACENNRVAVKYAEVNDYNNSHVLEYVEGSCYK